MTIKRKHLVPRSRYSSREKSKTSSKVYNRTIADTAAAFNKLYASPKRPPWDVDGPTPFVRELVESNSVRGEILDAGCGTGENAIFLASQGYHVTAFDAAPTAIEKARCKAAERGINIEFEVADARQLPYRNARFATIVDSGLFHVLARDTDRLSYARELARVTLPDASVHLLGFKARGPRWLNSLGTSVRYLLFGIGTHGISEGELQAAFSTGWRMDSVEERSYGWGQFILARIRRV